MTPDLSSPSPAEHRHDMVDRQLRSRGIRDERVLAAMESIPRERFLPDDQYDLAYADRALPISQGQTISQPYMVAAMTEAVAPGPDDRILEVGTGSGYQTAVLARLAKEVYTIERIPELSDRARAVLESLGIRNVRYLVGDGTCGWAAEAPFDGIVVTAGAPEAPLSLKRQLSSTGGRLVIPVGPHDLQQLYRYVRTGNELSSEPLMSCRFVPLVGREGW